MMDIHEALYTTRSMRRLKPDPIPYDVQARILDAAIHAPTIGEQWRFVLVDDRNLMARIAPLYREAMNTLVGQPGALEAMASSDSPMAPTARSGLYLINHFDEVPLLLIGFGRTRDGSGIYPALWSAMLAARAEGIGSTLTGVLQSFKSDEVFDLLGVPTDAGWVMHGAVPMGYPLGRWGTAKRQPVEKVAARNGWEGDLGFSVPEPLWPPQG
jgi:nitroreductase